MSFLKDKYTLKCFYTDNVNKIKEIVDFKYRNDDSIVKEYYKLSIKHNAQSILVFLVTECNYIEDLSQLIDFMYLNKFQKIYKYLLNNEDNTKYLVKYFRKLIKKKKFINFVSRINDYENIGNIKNIKNSRHSRHSRHSRNTKNNKTIEPLSTNRTNTINIFQDIIKPNIHKCIKIGFISNNMKFIRYIYDNIKPKKYDYKNCIPVSIIIKLCIKYDMDNLLNYILINWDIIHPYCFYEYNEVVIYHLHEYALYKNKKHIFRRIILNQKSLEFLHISWLEFYDEQDMIFIIDKIINNIKIRNIARNKILNKEDKDSIIYDHRNTYNCKYIISRLLKTNITKFDKIKFIKYLVEKYPIIFTQLKQDIFTENIENITKSHERKNYYNTIDTYKAICINSDDFELHNWYITLHNSLFNEQENKNHRVKNHRVKNHNIQKNKKSKLDLNKYFPYVFATQKLEFIREYIDRYNIKISNKMDDLYLGDIFQIPIFSLRNITLNEIINKFDFMLANYDIKLDTCKRYVDIVLLLFDHCYCNYRYNLPEDNRTKLFINFMKKFLIIENYIKDDENHRNDENYTNDKLAINILRSTYNSNNIELIEYVSEIININDLNFINLTNYIISNNLNTFNYIKNKFTKSNYTKFINDLTCKYYSTEFKKNRNIFPKYDVFKQLINDGLRFDKLEEIYIFSVWSNIEEDIIRRFDLMIENGYKHIYYNIEQMTESENDTYIVKYLPYLDSNQLYKIFESLCQYKKYYLIIYFLKTYKYEMTYQLINKYKLDKNKLQWQEDIEENETCAVCLTNSPCIIIQPCGHLILCSECSNRIDNKCPMDNTTITKKILLRGKTEDERLNCIRCGNNRIEYAYSKCGHSFCRKCKYKRKCPICQVKSKIMKIYIL